MVILVILAERISRTAAPGQPAKPCLKNNLKEKGLEAWLKW
jgi:hypothetical protein